MIILSGSAHPELAKQVALLFKKPLGKVTISKFPNGEKRIHIQSNLKNKSVVIVQPFSAPPDEHIIEFCLLVDAARHLGAKKIIGVVPWFGYSPQDKLFRPGEAVSAHVIAKLIQSLSLDHLLVVDIHSPKALKHFTIPTTQISALNLFVNHFKSKNLANHLAVALDKGSLPRMKTFAKALNLPLLKLHKSRQPNSGHISFKPFSQKLNSQHVVTFDDFISTGSTTIKAATLLKQHGAKTFTICATHTLLAGDSKSKLNSSPIDHIITTNSYPIPKTRHFQKLKILSIAPLLSSALESVLE